MITRDEIKNLAGLARIEMTDAEMDAMAHDFEAILGYVDQVNQVVLPEVSEKPLRLNVTRADENATASETYSGKMLAGAPDAQDGFYKVQKIL